MASIIKSDNGVSSGITGIVQSADSSGQLVLQTTTSGGTATTAVTIDTNQNVGLGVTPSAWGLGTNGHALEFSNAGSIWNYSNTTGISLSQNVYYNGAYYYKSTAAATLYGQGSGQHIWYSAPSGTAGTTFTPTQAMTLDASANLTVGAGITNTLTLTGSAYGMLTTTNDLYMQAGGTGSQIIFRRGSTENARIDASGNLLAGTTSTSGSMSNAAAFVGGSFKTATGSFASPPNGSWTTIATISQAGMYLVHAYINNYNAGPGNWSNAFVVSYTGAGPAYLWNLSGAGVGNINGQIVSSNQIQIYCGAGTGPVVYWTIARFGN